MEKLARAQADTSAEGALATKYAAGRALNILLLWTGGELALAYRTGATDADLERQAWRPMLEAAPKIFAAQAAVVARWEQKRGEATETQRRVHDPFFKVLPPLEVHASLSERLTLLAKLTGRKALVAEAFDALGPTIGKCKTVDEFMAFPHRLDRAVGVTTAPATREAEPVPASPSEAAAAERVIRRYFDALVRKDHDAFVGLSADPQLGEAWFNDASKSELHAVDWRGAVITCHRNADGTYSVRISGLWVDCTRKGKRQRGPGKSNFTVVMRGAEAKVLR